VNGRHAWRPYAVRTYPVIRRGCTPCDQLVTGIALRRGRMSCTRPVAEPGEWAPCMAPLRCAYLPGHSSGLHAMRPAS